MLQLKISQCLYVYVGVDLIVRGRWSRTIISIILLSL